MKDIKGCFYSIGLPTYNQEGIDFASLIFDQETQPDPSGAEKERATRLVKNSFLAVDSFFFQFRIVALEAVYVPRNPDPYPG
jgi:hypothetical protein